MTPEEKFAAEYLADDMVGLLFGTKPTKTALLDAPRLNWWSVERLAGKFYLFGVFHNLRPGPGSTLQHTGAVCWMAHDLTWCRSEDAWYRLGEMDLDL